MPCVESAAEFHSDSRKITMSSVGYMPCNIDISVEIVVSRGATYDKLNCAIARDAVDHATHGLVAPGDDRRDEQVCDLQCAEIQQHESARSLRTY